MTIVPAPFADRTFAELARWSGGVLVGLMGLVAAILVGRRAATAEPLSPAALFIVAILIAAAAVAARRLGASAPGRRAHVGRSHRAAVWAPLPMVVVAAAALSVPGTSAGGLAMLWGVLLLEETAWLVVPAMQGVRRGRAGWAFRWRRLRADGPQRPAPLALDAAALADAAPADECVQQLVRARTPDGGQRVSGWLRIDVVAGQRTANAHVAFCPPLDRAPAVEVEQSSGPAARIKTAQCLAYGVRFDLKLSQPLAQQSVVAIRFSAVSGPGGKYHHGDTEGTEPGVVAE
ncbi:MAG: hypothetical protein JW809_16320 [Pirellulales bacterium]|nr:hypothetical protein [Pirellulales bacterium]